MGVKREKIHFASVEELLGAPVDKEGTVNNVKKHEKTYEFCEKCCFFAYYVI